MNPSKFFHNASIICILAACVFPILVSFSLDPNFITNKDAIKEILSIGFRIAVWGSGGLLVCAFVFYLVATYYPFEAKENVRKTQIGPNEYLFDFIN